MTLLSTLSFCVVEVEVGNGSDEDSGECVSVCGGSGRIKI